jgi:hypothetical protein
MIEVRETEAFTAWLRGLKDHRALARIVERLHRASRGLLGDVEPVGEGVSEMRIDYDPATGSTSSAAGTPSSSCSAAATRGTRSATSSVPRPWQRRFDHA